MALDINNVPVDYILASRDSIRKKIIDQVQNFEQLSGVDLSKTHFFSYIVDILSVLSSDNSNSLTMSRKENYLVTAQMPSSIYNWASYLSYSREFATPSTTYVLLQIPLDFTSDTSFIIPKYHKFYADNIIFTANEQINITYIETTNTLTARLQSDTSLLDLNVVTEDNNSFISIPVSQTEIIEFEQSVPGTLKLYQPYTFNVTFRDYLSGIKMYVQEDESATPEEWEYIQNYFTMNLGQKGFSIAFIDNSNVRILFGNGVFGRQPTPGSTVSGSIFVTKASEGNIIPGTIKSLDPIVYSDAGITKRVRIIPINVEASSGGSEEETLDDTKRKSINRFKARNRIVSEEDFMNMKDIISEGIPFPITHSVLKRSDIKMNEIVTYVILPEDIRTYNPTALTTSLTGPRQIYVPRPTNSIKQVFSNSTTEILPYTTFTDTTDAPYIYDYVCPFGIIIEGPTFSYYYYMVNNVDVNVNVALSDTVNYPLVFPNLNLQSINNYSDFKLTLDFKNPESIDLTNIECRIYLKFKTSVIGPEIATIDEPNGQIFHTFSSSGIKSEEAEIVFEFHDLTTGDHLFTIVRANYFIKRNMRNIMFSNCKPEVDGAGTITCYDIPVIEKTYWDSLTSDEQSAFELNTIQQFVSNLFLGNYRMLTVNINMKFAKTHGRIHTYDLNEVSHEPVIDILNAPPVSPTQGDRYIVGQDPSGLWTDLTNSIVVWSGTIWIPLYAKPGEIIYVSNLNKRYTFNGNANRWIEVLFETPFKVKAYVYIGGSTVDEVAIVNTIKQNIMYAIAPNFGIQGEIHRSIISEAVQTLRELGVLHCEIKIPEVDIEFNFDIQKFTTAQLIEYVPVYVYTLEENIDVTIVRSGY